MTASINLFGLPKICFRFPQLKIYPQFELEIMDIQHRNALLLVAPGESRDAAVPLYETLGARIMVKKSVNTNLVLCHPTLAALSAKDRAKAEDLRSKGCQLVELAQIAQGHAAPAVAAAAASIRAPTSTSGAPVIDIEEQQPHVLQSPGSVELPLQIITTRGEKFQVKQAFATLDVGTSSANAVFYSFLFSSA